jgi:hypothetical protein
MNQSKIESLSEAVVNTAVGFGITIVALPAVNWICNIEMSVGQAAWSTTIFTAISVIRGYVIRRFFNNLFWIKNKLRTLLAKF